ncbi:MAG: DUF58 domain-containing protein [Planctomycetota bacterium]
MPPTPRTRPSPSLFRTLWPLATFQLQSSLPWLVLATLTIPLVWVCVRARIHPTSTWTLVLVASIAASVIGIFAPSFLYLVVAIDLALVLASLIDAALILAMTHRGIEVHRELPATVSLGVPLESSLTIRNESGLDLVGDIRDDLPESFRADPEEHLLNLPRGGELHLRRRLTPMRRGAFTLEKVYLRFQSPWKFWTRYTTFDVAGSINVYPDMKQLADYALLARTDRLSLIGVRKTRRIGQDSDFERLRDYSRDDNYRHIDWRSTARRRKLTVRDFQSDQSQRLIFMLDCGRMMTNTREGLTLLDHSLNAMLMMAYVALSKGDSVGFLCFSDRVHSFITPKGGPAQMNRLLRAGFNEFPRMVESRYDQAFVYLSNHCRKRSLVVMATNLIDEVNSQSVMGYLGNMAGQHLPLAVLLRDRQMFDAAESPAASAALHDDNVPPNHDFYRAAAAADILLWRDQVIRDLNVRGVLTIDAFPDELTAALVNEYLRIKAKHLL